MGRRYLPVLVYLAHLRAAVAQGQQYITDLGIFTSLAPCASAAVSQNVQDLTSSQCPQAVSALESCVCSQGNNLKSIAAQISSSVAYSCGSTASDDQASAQTMLSAYCSQAASITFAPPSVSLQQYITDFPAYSNLAPCAEAAIGSAVLGMTNNLCPAQAGLLATCVCEKNQNSIVVTEQIGSSAYQYCSSQTDDVSSAQALFSAYCNLLSGTTNFPTPSNPPGDMTYYITDLPEYSSLAPCAATALSYGVFSKTYDVCPTGPEALASCVCLKDSVPLAVSSLIVQQVLEDCSSTDSVDVSSAISVYNLYCSAAKGLATPTGVTTSVEQTYQTVIVGVGTGRSGSQPTGGSGSGNGSNGSGNGSGSHSSGPSIGLIVGIAVGVVAILAVLGLVIFFVMRSARRRKAAYQPAPQDQSRPETAYQPTYANPMGQPELAGSPVNAAAMAPPPPGSPSPSMLKAGMTPHSSSVSPLSPNLNNMYSPGQQQTPPPPMPTGRPELMGQAMPYPPPMPTPSPQPGVPGQNPIGYPGQPQQQRYEFPAQNSVYEAGSTPAPHPAHPGGLGYQAGPVPGFSELDSESYYHAR